MFYKKYFLIALIFFVNCSPTQKIADQNSNTQIYSEGIKPIISNEFPLQASSIRGVAKLYKGNSAYVNGVFISKDGLFLTNYSSILEQIASNSDPKKSLFRQGVVASSKGEEIPLQGISLMIEVEQKDVTDEVRKEITELSPNSEIFQSIQTQKNLLINERRGEREDLLVEIQDTYSGLRHIMTVYEIVDDIRLVYAPELDIYTANAGSSEHIFNEVTDKFAILRAYSSSINEPYTPGHFFPLSNQIPEKSSELIALGFPNQTYRLETSRAINFYHKQLNPTIISSFEIFLQKEDTLAAIDTTFALKSVPTRFNVAQNVNYFEKVQSLISEYDVIQRKSVQEEEFLNWVNGDTTLPASYSQLMNYINKAYDIAEQTSDIYFTSNYFNNFSFLDNLADVYRTYNSSLEDYDTQKDIDSLRNTTLNTHKELLSRTNIGAELFMLKRFLVSFASVQEKQKPLILFDLFSGTAGDDLQAFSIEFVDQIAPSSFLLNLNRASEVLSSGSTYADPLFTLLDEILFTQESSQQSYLLHYAYLYPAQQVYTQARLERTSKNEFTPDANTSLAFNIGSLNMNMTVPDSPFFYTTNDFSGKASGSAILNSNGELAGLVSDEINDSILGNYVYSRESSFLKALSSTSVRNELMNTPNSDFLLRELNLKQDN